MIRQIAQRVAVLVDAQNMYHSAKHLHGARLNFGKAVEYVVGDRPLVRAIAYVAKSKTGEEDAFFEALIEAKIEPRIKDVQEYSSGVKKADWDVGMAIDAVMLSEKVDVIILMTGDGDFIPLVEYLHGRGVIVEVAAFGESMNSKFREVIDGFTDLSDAKKFLIKSAHSRVPRGAQRTSDSGSKRTTESKEPRGGKERRIKVNY